jgi:diadenosine tetraphosphate (Ap4A) HIT family hydrolase
MPLPGGLIHETPLWLVEHCIGPLGVGTLIVKPRRHVTRVSELSRAELGELGPLLGLSAAAVDALVEPEQVYVCLWSHAGGVPVHVHWVVQPVTRVLMDRYGVLGPALQRSMFDERPESPLAEVELFAERARRTFARS